MPGLLDDAFSYGFDPYLKILATPRYKGDSLASEFQQKIADANASIAGLRADPRNASLVQDARAPINFTNTFMGDETTGDYTPSTNKINVRLGGTPAGMQETAYHELLHSLQHQSFEPASGLRDENAFRGNPLAVLNQGAAFSQSDTPVGANKETPSGFAHALSKAGINYGYGEPAAFLASNLNQNVPIKSQGVQEMLQNYPVLSAMYAQMNSQPNRPLPKHYKGEPEWSTMDRILNKTLGYRPEITMDQRVNAASDYANSLAGRTPQLLR